MQEEQAVIPIHIPDGGASFTIGRHIGQLIVFTESLPVVGGADASRDIHFLRHHVIPDTVDGVDVTCIARQGSNVCHSGIHISGPYGMSDSFILFQHRFMCLAIGIPAFRITTFI